MRQYPVCVALLCGAAMLGTVSAASAGGFGFGWGTGCGCNHVSYAAPAYYAPTYTLTTAYVAQPVTVAVPQAYPYAAGSTLSYGYGGQYGVGYADEGYPGGGAYGPGYWGGHYLRHGYLGHGYLGHGYIGRGYPGREFVGRNFVARGYWRGRYR